MAKKNGNGKALVVVEAFLPVAENYDDLKALVADNIGDDEVSAFSLPKIKMPAAGGLQWTHDGVALSSLQCIILHWKCTRGFWPGDFSGNTPPQCAAANGRVGVGEPGGTCKTCPLSQWDSGKDGRGQACKEMRPLMIVLPGELLPVRVTLPPSSIKPFKLYMMSLINKQVPYWQAVTKIGLAGAVTQTGIKYSVATFEMADRLDADAVARLAVYRDGIVDQAVAAPVEAGDYAPE